MAEKEEVISTIRATLLSCKGSLSLKAVNRDYRELQGEFIPFAELGYKSLIELFKSVPGFRLHQCPDGEYMIDVIPSEMTRGLADLISKQKTSKKGSGRFSKPLPRRSKAESWKPTASSKYWQYKHTNHISRHNNAYFKPQSPEKKYSKQTIPPRQITKAPQNVPDKTAKNIVSDRTAQNIVPDRSMQKIVSDKTTQNNVSSNAKNMKPKKSSAIIESQKSPPASSLSGFRPGDILAKAGSNVRNVL